MKRTECLAPDPNGWVCLGMAARRLADRQSSIILNQRWLFVLVSFESLRQSPLFALRTRCLPRWPCHGIESLSNPRIVLLKYLYRLLFVWLRLFVFVELGSLVLGKPNSVCFLPQCDSVIHIIHINLEVSTVTVLFEFEDKNSSAIRYSRYHIGSSSQNTPLA